MMHSFIPPDRFFPYLTWTDIQAMPDKENVVNHSACWGN
jgi:creatinine amidohydrolase